MGFLIFGILAVAFVAAGYIIALKNDIFNKDGQLKSLQNRLDEANGNTDYFRRLAGERLSVITKTQAERDDYKKKMVDAKAELYAKSKVEELVQSKAVEELPSIDPNAVPEVMDFDCPTCPEPTGMKGEILQCGKARCSVRWDNGVIEKMKRDRVQELLIKGVLRIAAGANVHR